MPAPRPRHPKPMAYSPRPARASVLFPQGAAATCADGWARARAPRGAMPCGTTGCLASPGQRRCAPLGQQDWRAWRGRDAGCKHFFFCFGWRGRGAGMSCSPWGMRTVAALFHDAPPPAPPLGRPELRHAHRRAAAAQRYRVLRGRPEE
eukprot:gene16164-biopygen15798